MVKVGNIRVVLTLDDPRVQQNKEDTYSPFFPLLDSTKCPHKKSSLIILCPTFRKPSIF